jgi:uncharacterized membrane protein (UPF0127 family)
VRAGGLLAAAFGLGLVACAPSTTLPSPQSAWPVRTIEVDGERLTVVAAMDPAVGLRGTTALGELDGMLFAYPGEVEPALHRFTMDGVRIPLDVAFFDAEGRLIAILAMPVCDAGPCPAYESPRPFRWALETPAGALDLGPTAILDPTG